VIEGMKSTIGSADRTGTGQDLSAVQARRRRYPPIARLSWSGVVSFSVGAVLSRIC